MYNKPNLTFNYQFTGNLGIFHWRGTYIFIVRITFSKKADATIYTRYYLLCIPVIKNSCYHWLYPAIHCTEYDEITMINETRQNIVVLTINIFAVQLNFGSCYTQHHAQTLHPTEKFISMNLLQMSCVITFEVVEAVRGQKHHISAHTLAL